MRRLFVDNRLKSYNHSPESVPPIHKKRAH
jgi:hypothetical protein